MCLNYIFSLTFFHCEFKVFDDNNDIIECMMVVNNLVCCHESVVNRNSDVQKSVALSISVKIIFFA